MKEVQLRKIKIDFLSINRYSYCTSLARARSPTHLRYLNWTTLHTAVSPVQDCFAMIFLLGLREAGKLFVGEPGLHLVFQI